MTNASLEKEKRVKILPPEVASKIAAGEVVTRPASVIKELVENAIDAGATRIIINVSRDVTSYLQVIDNGVGIHPDDIKIIFEHHSTSKIENVDDIYNLRTLGFRGEALSSIASVSRVELITRKPDVDLGKKVVVEGGKIISESDVSTPGGTIITVYHLFFNVPARKKFLKSASTELKHVEQEVKDHALARPDIKFILKVDKKLTLETPGNGRLLDTIFSIHGKTIAKNLLEINHEEQGIKIKGYIGKPYIARKKPDIEYYFINKRPIKSRLIRDTIKNALKTVIMRNHYPVVFLHLEMPAANIDVNVHPSKREVKFNDENLIRAVLGNAIQNVISGKPLAPIIEDTKPLELEFKAFDSTKTTEDSTRNTTTRAGQIFDLDTSSVTSKKQRDTTGRKFSKTLLLDKEQKASTSQEFTPFREYEKIFGCKVMFQLMKTYIVCDGKDSLIIFDQHAAHERILLEKLQSREKSLIKSQALLIPLRVKIKPHEKEVIEKFMSTLEENGFKISLFEDHFMVEAVPTLLGRINDEKYIEEFFEELIHFEEIDDLNLEVLKLIACKSAIKAGDALDQDKMEELLDALARTKLKYSCCHGRPTMIEFPRKTLDKMFRRIL